MASVFRGKKNPVNSSRYLPITLHYYNGRLGLRGFGHVGLQVGEHYLSYGLDKEAARCHSTTQVDTSVEIESRIYGTHSFLTLPVDWCLSPEEIEKKIHAFEDKWQPRNYSVAKRNCAHCATDGVLTFLDLKKIPSELKSELEAFATGYFAKPAEANQIIGKLNQRKMTLREEELKGITGKKSLSGESTESIKTTLEKLLDNTIDKLNSDIFTLKPKWHSKTAITDTQKAIFLLIEIREKLATQKLPDLQKSLETIQEKIGGLNDYAAENVMYCQELLKEKLLKRIDLSDEEKIYQTEHKQQLTIKNNLLACYYKHEEIINLLNENVQPESVFGFKHIILGKIDRLYHHNLNEIREGRDANYALQEALKHLISTSFKETNIDQLAKYALDAGSKDSRKEIGKLKQTIETFSNTNIIDMPVDAINNLASQIKTEIININKPQKEQSIPDEKKEIPDRKKTTIIGPQHLAWLDFQIKKINHWYLLNKTENTPRVQALAIQVYLHQRNSETKLPADQFKEMLDKYIRFSWHESATKYKTVVADQKSSPENRVKTDKKTVDYLNKKQKHHSYARDLGNLILHAEKMLGLPTESFNGLVLPYSENPANLNSKLAQESYAEMMFIKLKTVDFILLPDDLSTKAYLVNTSHQLQTFVTSHVITYQEALKELLEELNRATIFSQQKSSPDRKFSSSLEKIKVDMVTDVPEPMKQPGESKKSHENQTTKILFLVKTALEELKSSSRTPDEINDIYLQLQKIDDSHQPKKVLTDIVDMAKNILNNPGCRSDLERLKAQPVSTVDKSKSMLVFLLGIVTLKQDMDITDKSNPLTQIRNLGMKSLSSFSSLLDEKPILTTKYHL